MRHFPVRQRTGLQISAQLCGAALPTAGAASRSHTKGFRPRCSPEHFGAGADCCVGREVETGGESGLLS